MAAAAARGRQGCKRAAAVPATVLVGSRRVLGRGCESVRAGVCRVVAWCVEIQTDRKPSVVDALLSLVSTRTVVNRDLYSGCCYQHVWID